MSTFPSKDGTVLHELAWPAEKPRAAVAIFHGYGENIARYDELGRALAARGFTVRGIDFRGHGQSAGVRGHVERFSEYLDDVDALLARCAERPLFVLGHSNGALAVSEYLIQRGAGPIAGVILTSPFYAVKLKVSPIKVGIAKLASSFLPKMSLPTGVKGTDVCRDPELQKKYEADPLNNKSGTVRWFTEALTAQANVAARASEIKLPLLMVQGAADHVADPEVSKTVFARVGSADKTLKLLDGQYHEVFNELPEIRKQNFDAVCDWIDTHIHAATSEKVARS